MAFGNFFTGTPATSQQFSTITPQQAGVKGAASNQALKMLQGLGANGANNFQPIANQARTQFQTQTIPSLAERFTSLGGQRSSAFQGALGSAASGLEQGLAALGAQFGQQQQGLDQQLLGLLLNSSLAPEADTEINQEQPGFLQQFGPSILKLLPLLFGGLLGGPAGAAAGGALGTGANALAQYFSPQQQTNQPGFPQNNLRISNVLGQQNPSLNLPNYGGLISSILGGQ